MSHRQLFQILVKPDRAELGSDQCETLIELAGRAHWLHQVDCTA
jgi:hypothetical protein